MNDLTFAIHTLGCKVNSYESDMMAQNLTLSGFREVGFDDKADIYIINTCTVTNIASRKSRQMLRRCRSKNKDALIVGAGCLMDNALLNNDLSKLIDDHIIDLAVSNENKAHIHELIKEKLSQKSDDLENPENLSLNKFQNEKERLTSKSNESSSDPLKNDDSLIKEKPHSILSKPDSHTRAFVKVEDGCDNFCSYCIIPYVRGRTKIRPNDETLSEIRTLAGNGVAEVVIDGISLSSMGDKLIELLREIEKIDGIKRVRLGSIEPTIITEEVVKSFSHFTKLCPHFHLSLQSGSDEILKKMNRHYTTYQYEKSCEILRKYFTHPAITTDIMVGFPGETEVNFEESMKFVQKMLLFRAHVFKFSRRKNTPAYSMDGQLTETVKKERSQRMLSLTKKLSREFMSYYLGKELEFLSEELSLIDDEICETGYTREYVRCVKPALRSYPEKKALLHQNELISGVGTKLLPGERLLLK